MVRQPIVSYQAGRAADEPTPEPKRRRTLPPAVWMTVSLLLLVGIWQAIVTLRNYPAFVLPAPGVVLARLLAEFQGGTLPHHTLVTLTEALGGFALALLVSLVLGYLLAHSPRTERLLAPQLAATQAIPIV